MPRRQCHGDARQAPGGAAAARRLGRRASVRPPRKRGRPGGPPGPGETRAGSHDAVHPRWPGGRSGAGLVDEPRDGSAAQEPRLVNVYLIGRSLRLGSAHPGVAGPGWRGRTPGLLAHSTGGILPEALSLRLVSRSCDVNRCRDCTGSGYRTSPSTVSRNRLVNAVMPKDGWQTRRLPGGRPLTCRCGQPR
jgi:hypothetical protein